MRKLFQNKIQLLTNINKTQFSIIYNTNDELVDTIVKNEEKRQVQGINLIASENHCSQAVLDALSSVVAWKSGSYEHQGQLYVKKIDELCQKRALQTFDLDPQKWGVSVQSYSGAAANFNVYCGLLKPHERILGLDLAHGGHLSHGFQTKSKKVSIVSHFWESIQYRQNEQIGEIDYDRMEQVATTYNPKIVIAGASAYSRLIDYKRFREVCDQSDSILLADMAHISGLVAAKVIPSPFDHCDIVTTTTHKSLRGPRGSLTFYRIGVKGVDKKGTNIYYNLEEKIKAGVTMNQGSPQFHTITSIAVALKQAQSTEFVEYQKQVLQNSKSFAQNFIDKGYKLVGDKTENHLFLLDLRTKGLDGFRLDAILEQISIYANKNTVPGDISALNPSGLRIGTPAMTTRGFQIKDFAQTFEYIDRAVQLIPLIQKNLKKKSEFKKHLEQNGKNIPEVVALKKEVVDYVSQFPVPSLN